MTRLRPALRWLRRDLNRILWAAAALAVLLVLAAPPWRAALVSAPPIPLVRELEPKWRQPRVPHGQRAADWFGYAEAVDLPVRATHGSSSLAYDNLGQPFASGSLGYQVRYELTRPVREELRDAYAQASRLRPGWALPAVRYAMRVAALEPLSEGHVPALDLATDAAVAADPHNALVWYLRGVSLLQRKDRAGAVAAVAHANRLARPETYDGPARQAAIRYLTRRGLNANQATDELRKIRSTRYTQVLWTDLIGPLAQGASRAQAIELLVLAARLANEAANPQDLEYAYEAFGRAVAALAPWPQMLDSTADRRRELAASSYELAEQLRATGQADQAAWLQRASDRFAAYQAFALRPSNPPIALRQFLYLYTSWAAVLLALAALVLVIAAGRGRALPDIAWPARDLLRIWVLTVGSYLIFLAADAIFARWLQQTLVNNPEGLGPAAYAWLVITTFASVLWPWVASVLLLRRLLQGAPAHFSTPGAYRQVHRALYLPTAALLLVLAAASLTARAGLDDSGTHGPDRATAHAVAASHAAMDTAGRPLPVTWAAP